MIFSPLYVETLFLFAQSFRSMNVVCVFFIFSVTRHDNYVHIADKIFKHGGVATEHALARNW